MSVFDLPRLHFGGHAVTRLPTGLRNGLVDLSAHSVLTDDGPFPAERPAQEYHDYLDARGPRFDASGRMTPDGPFSASKGWNFRGNGHFWIDATIVSAEGADGPDRRDPVVGRSVDMWGHHNEYLATTFNRARVFDCDPASDWATTLMVGQFCFGRRGRSHEVGYMLVGDVTGTQPPRWHNFRHLVEAGDHCLAAEFRRSTVHQLVVRKDTGLEWLPETQASPVVTALRAAVDRDDVAGLVVQFALRNMSAPTAPDEPNSWSVHGTIAPWYEHEFATYPAGRLLSPRRAGRRGSDVLLHNLGVAGTAHGVVLNMTTAVPVRHRAPTAGPGPLHALGPVADLGDLELRTVRGGHLLARIPAAAYTAEELALTSGIVTVPWAGPDAAPRYAAAEQALCLTGTTADGERAVLLVEEEVNVQADDACLVLDHPDRRNGDDHAREIEVRSFVRGVPAPVDAIRVRQFFNPRALPLDAVAADPRAKCGDLEVCGLRAGPLADPGPYAAECVIATDGTGRGRFTVRGARAGGARILLSAGPGDEPCDLLAPGSARRAYDNDDALGHWAAAGSLVVRVLPDDWHLDDVEDVTFDLVYREVFAFYELCTSFMRQDVFSLADECKVETYARLVWQMCDPRNKAKTYYMPSTRDLSEPKARLLRKYLRGLQRPGPVMSPAVPGAAPRHRPGGITDRTGLCAALRQAATAEFAVMMQYIYAAYSIPTHRTGQEYVRRGLWTPDQLALLCGDGTETLDHGLRGTLLTVAKEEMIHFIAVNNIILALGEPFHVPATDFARINRELPIPLEFALEGFGVGSLQRFIAVEQPEHLTADLPSDPCGGPAAPHRARGYASLGELYGDLRQAVGSLPDLFLVERGRGGPEHHLFMRESVNAVHPDYQLQVDDVASALFAIDFVTEQGEGHVLPPAGKPSGPSHHETFLRAHNALSEEQVRCARTGRTLWDPAYPVMRNPTLSRDADATKDLVTDPEAREVMELFNHSFFMMVQLMVQHYGWTPDASLRRSVLMNASIDVMTGMLRPLGELLVTMPSGRRGRTAGPSFELGDPPGYVARPDVAFRAMALRFEHLARRAAKCARVPESVPALMTFYADRFRREDVLPGGAGGRP
ncbi:ferritin-like domain-containing protein [Streptomyces beigongshangae]|uniref:ferritin-like domain-containing protein n=1 Tax=Streptomyces beigongshangae TaxID=2841597 RepID=UPI001C861B64|nr:ferritin-like domain-containing protein [Streptomyces sp. REN17]